MTTISFTSLPLNVQEKVKSKLSAYDEAFVERQNGQYEYRAGLYLDTTKKASDYAFFTFTKDDVFTKEEQAANYAELTESFQNTNVPDSFWN